MAVKVLVERSVKAGFEAQAWNMLRDLRSEALRARGYLYGETWRSVDNKRMLMTLSVWGTLEHWQRWEESEARQRMTERIRPMLRRRSAVRVFEDAVDPFVEAEPNPGAPAQPR